MPISSFDSTGRSGASRLPTRTCSVARDEAADRPGDAPGEEEGEDERDDERAEADEDLRVLDLAEGRELPFAAAQGDGRADELIGGRADRQDVRDDRSRRRPRAASGPIVLPWRSTAWTRSSRRAIAASAALPSGPIVDAASAALAGSAGLAASARKTTCVFSSCSRLRATSSLIWKPAAMTPTRRVPPSSTGAATTL